MDHETRHSFNSSTRVESLSVIRERMEDREILSRNIVKRWTTRKAARSEWNASAAIMLTKHICLTYRLKLLPVPDFLVILPEVGFS